jgi:enoyl-CoA hydratase/carnithine racemase
VSESPSDLIALRRDRGVAFATIDAPPVNVITVELMMAIARTVDAVEADPDVRVLVWQSANPEFFVAHFDVEAILAIPTDDEPSIGEPNAFAALTERIRTMSTVTICAIAGRVGGGGAELAASCDLRFGALDRMVLNQMEVPLGILPGGSGTTRLPHLVGRGRALEIVLAGDDIDARTAADWGWLNRALPADELDEHVAAVAHRIAGFPAAAVAEAKASVDAALTDPGPALAQESWRFQRLLRTPEARRRLRRFLQLGGQTSEVERHVADIDLTDPEA